VFGEIDGSGRTTLTAMSVPRLVVAAPHSGAGKTTVATGLMAALRTRLRVGAAKVGPDFIDPSYHALATGRPSRNLDAWICGDNAVAPVAAKAAAGTDVLVVEGVMGLFDGAADDGHTASTAHVAKLLQAPVLLVVDASAMSGSVAAVVHGFTTYDKHVKVAGVVLNRVGSDGHEVMLREALAPLGIPVVGALRRDDAFAWRDRHLGLVPVVERPQEIAASLDRLATAVDRSCDLDTIVAVANQAPPLDARPLPDPRPQARVRVAVAQGKAFSFSYPDNLEALEQAGAELLPFDPTHDVHLPDGSQALVAGGGFPEVYAEQLAANEPLLADVKEKVDGGLVTWAECGGLLWLARSLDDHQMAGVIDAKATMTRRLTLGYRTATPTTDTPVAKAQTELRGHEFHYSSIEPAGDALHLTARFGQGQAGFGTPTLLAGYLHLHLASRPDIAERFVATVEAAARRGKPV
jgi:cobyrinic acid a,c-diamide synthase